MDEAFSMVGRSADRHGSKEEEVFLTDKTSEQREEPENWVSAR